MCGGARPSAGRVTSPDTGSYDRMLNAQIQAMEALQGGALRAGQDQLNQLLTSEQNSLAELRDLKVARANASAADAARIMSLLGPPPPDKTAKAPALGPSRGMGPRPGRKQLRSDTPARPTQGTGLNIP